MRNTALWILLSVSAGLYAESISVRFIPITFPVSDDLMRQTIRAAFPELADSDRMLPICENGAMDGMWIRFAESPSSDRFVLKSSVCKFAERGLTCTDLEKWEVFYYETTELHFTLGEGISYQEAVRVIEAFKQHGIRGLPDWSRGLDYRQLSRIDRSDDGYILATGDLSCMHCTARFEVKFEDEDELVLINVQDAICV